MKNLLRKFKKARYWVPTVIVIIIALIILMPGNGPTYESEKITRGTVAEIISGTGIVTVSNELSLSFEAQGSIDSIYVNEGDEVNKGQALASLDKRLLQNDVEIARSALQSQEAKLQEMLAGLSPTEEKSALTKLETARLDLLTSDIEAYFTGDQVENSSFSYTPPTISGIYTGDEEGSYIITLYRSGSQSGYSFSYKGLESGIGEVSVEKPEKLGNKGLYIEFPENFARAPGVEWTVEIPNTRHSQYSTKKQAYEQALADYNLAVEGSRPEQITAQRANVEQARASYNKALNTLSKATLNSPISGIISSVPAVVGETVSPGQTIVNLISNENGYITLYIPESDIANLSVEDKAQVEFIAFPNEIFEARVEYISPSAEQREGVTVFKTRIEFIEPDPRIRVGMSADVDIFSQSVENVLSISGRAIIRSGDETFVRLIKDDEVIEQPVEMGLRGSDGRIEIKSGLEEGDEVITFIREEDLKELTK